MSKVSLRLMGAPADVQAVARALAATGLVAFTPRGYRNRGGSQEVRVYGSAYDRVIDTDVELVSDVLDSKPVKVERKAWSGSPIPQTRKRPVNIYKPNMFGVAMKIIGDAIVWDRNDPRHPEYKAAHDT